MKIVSPSRWLPVFQWLAGSCDTATGVLLVFTPAWTLKLMGVQRLPQPIEFVSFVGVFVLGVGLAYLSIARLPLNAKTAPRWQTVWRLTALIRALVAGFLSWQILTSRMETAWLAVAVTDGALALIQWFGLQRCWLDFKD
ncbi:MAG TPA: hypothetical protein VL863_08130 [bacterium]|nr:hypothetical protein [bacterium]